MVEGKHLNDSVESIQPLVLYLFVLIRYFIFLNMLLVLLWVELIMPESCNLPVSCRIRQFLIIFKDLFARLCLSAENMLQTHVFLKLLQNQWAQVILFVKLFMSNNSHQEYQDTEKKSFVILGKSFQIV